MVSFISENKEVENCIRKIHELEPDAEIKRIPNGRNLASFIKSTLKTGYIWYSLDKEQFRRKEKFMHLVYKGKSFEISDHNELSKFILGNLLCQKDQDFDNRCCTLCYEEIRPIIEKGIIIDVADQVCGHCFKRICNGCLNRILGNSGKCPFCGKNLQDAEGCYLVNAEGETVTR